MSTSEIGDLRLDLNILDSQFRKWLDEDDALSGVTNVKITKAKNADLRLKMTAWNNRKPEFKNAKKKVFEHGKKLREYF